MELNEPVSLHDRKAAMPVNEQLAGEELATNVENRFGFRIGRYRFVLEKTLVTEILIKPTIYKIPNSPVWIYGMINLRGNIMPVMDFANTLGSQHTNSVGEFILVIDKGRDAMAVLVDALPKLLVNPAAAGKMNDSKLVAKDFASEGVRMQDDIWDQLDIKKLAMAMKCDA